MVTRVYNCIFILLIAGFLFSSLTVSAGGKQEDSISRARVLMEEKRYNDAILLLSEVMRNQPRRFDEAQALVKEIQRVRSSYNSEYENLIKLFGEDELDLDRAYEIVDGLEEMDKSPNKATDEALTDARETILFLYYKKQFDDLMARAKTLLDEEKFWEAAVTYLEGFEYYKKEFENRDYGDLVFSQVIRARESIGEAALAFQATRGALTRTYESWNGFISNDAVSSLNTLNDQLFDVFREIGHLRKQVYRSAQILNNQNEQIQTAQEKEDFHLSYVALMGTGRREVDFKEGVIGAIDLLYAEYFGQMSGTLRELTAQYYDAAVAALEEGNLDAAESGFARAEWYGTTGVELLSLWGERIYVDESVTLSDEEYNLVMDHLDAFLEFRVQAAGSRMYLSLADDIGQLYAAWGNIDSSGNVDDLQQSREVISDVRLETEREREVWGESINSLERIESAYPASAAPALQKGEQFSQRLGSVIEDGIEGERDTVARIARVRYTPLEAGLEEEIARIDTSEELLEGYEEQIGEGEEATTIILNDPAGGLTLLDESRINLNRLRDDISGVIEYLREQQEYIRQSDQAREELETGNTLVSRINSLFNRIARLEGDMEEQVLLARRYREEGFYRLDRARNLLGQNDFTAARDQVRQAGISFDQSLAVQIDPDLSAQRDQLLTALSEEINTAQNNLIVAEVRQLIDEAKDFYTQERYDAAERNLTKAQARWKITHVEEKPEIEYWLRIVRVALNVQTGRTIEESNPLYIEMSQLLNLARQNFLEGRKLVQQGNRNAAQVLFQEAEKNLLFIKIPFPLNKEASVLSLRILQYSNPDNFETLFRQKFNEAVGQIETAPQEAYINLKDLEAIYPNYPGIQNAIYRTEIALGMRIPPPDPATLRRAEELYQRAFAIVARNVRAEYTIALTLLNQAIELTPDDQRIINLLDRVEAQIGGRTTTVLDSEAQRQYSVAEQKYIEGSYFEALRIVNQLMQNPRNSQYPPLLELKRRIESNI